MASRELIQAIAVTAELCGAKLSEAAASALILDLSSYPEKIVIDALSRVRRSGKRFSLGAIIEEIEQHDGRPGADAAWAMLPMSENQTVVWTQEMQSAWGIAAPLMEIGDKFGARKAFVEEYERQVSQNRERGIPPRWEASLGLDPHGREVVVRQAVEKGLLPAAQLQALLPAPDMTKSPIAAIAFGGCAKPMIEGDAPMDREKALEMLARLKEELKGGKGKTLSQIKSD